MRKRDGGNGEEVRIRTRHTLSRDQCGFVLAGSALNLLAAKGRAGGVDADA